MKAKKATARTSTMWATIIRPWTQFSAPNFKFAGETVLQILARLWKTTITDISLVDTDFRAQSAPRWTYIIQRSLSLPATRQALGIIPLHTVPAISPERAKLWARNSVHIFNNTYGTSWQNWGPCQVRSSDVIIHIIGQWNVPLLCIHEYKYTATFCAIWSGETHIDVSGTDGSVVAIDLT